MSKYKPTIGLEIHAELKTDTKMFCNSRNDAEETRPNVNVCPVCMAHPGTLPVINKQAIEHVIKVGLALDGEIADFTEFDRKNYFYPDIPKGYQISQYKYPIVSGGKLVGVELTRIHLEEDTATSRHGKDFSLVDYNRAGVPLMELVTEPYIENADEAVKFAKELQHLLRYLGISDANMEKGQMRVEANISVSATEEFGTKVEVKNLNSFKAVERAIQFEIQRMSELLDEGRGDEIMQETRGWNEDTQETFSQRKKESSEDYRYFPDPDLPKLKLHEVFDINEIEKTLPELPWQKRDRYKKEFNMRDEAIELFIGNFSLGEYFEKVVTSFNGDEQKTKLASNYITTDVVSHMREKQDSTLPEPAHFAELIDMIADGKISSRGAKDILEIMHGHDDSPSKIAEEKNLLQKSDEGELKSIIEKLLDAHPSVVEEYKGGKESSLQFFVGQAMKATHGSANPQIVTKILKDLLST
ncbi:Asp-tRNA(Asn)/Glu-tRNA(Gln) amidotransferase GatCAB subunit B [Candidatus Wolfebacteria bacterium]|nr:MAG: Asp-tRNA(Asn)/Glu-tRNA(Gln) amidotransferase GatCAB subunit B [Candidatus Wolfebacteria bacterium]